MGRSALRATLVGFVVSLTVSAYTATEHAKAERQKPVKVRTIHADGGLGAPATLEELWSLSPLVIDAVIKSSRPADTTLTVPGSKEPAAVIVQTAYELKIREVFKDAAAIVPAGKRIEVLQVGGERDRGEYIDSIVDPTFQRLQNGERYIFFLKPSEHRADTFVMATDTADSALLLTAEATVEARGRSKLARGLERNSREDLLNRLRTLAEVRR